MAKQYNKNQGSRFSDGIVSEGHVTLNGSLWIPDAAIDTGPNDEDPGYINLGDDNDMNIHVSGSKHGVVRQLNTAGNLYLQSAKIDGGEVRITKNGAQETLAVFKNGPDVTDQPAGQNYAAGCFLYHNNSPKLRTLGPFNYGADSDPADPMNESCGGGVKINGPAVAAAANVVAGQPYVDSSLVVGRIIFDQGINTNDHCMIKWVSTEDGLNDRSALDFILADNVSDTVTSAEKFRFRMHCHLDDINSGNEYSLVEISGKGNGSTRMDLTQSPGSTSEVIADTFTGTATSVSSLTGLTTDNLTEGTNNKYYTDTQVDSHISVLTGTASDGGSLSYDEGAFTFAPAQLASADAAGIASFSTNDFTVSAAGAVTLNSLKNGDIASDAAIAYSKLANVTGNTIVGNNTATAASAKFLTAANMITFLGIATNADNYDGWNINHKEDAADETAHTATKIGSTGNVKFVGNGATKITRSSGTITITSANDNTEYTASGNYGMNLNGKAFELKDDRRRNSNAVDVHTGQKHEFIKFNHDVLGNKTDHGAMMFFTEGLEEMRLDKDGNLHVNSDIIGYSTTPSDERLKENIRPVNNALDKVSQLKGVTFDWERNGEASAGVIAQDLEKVLPSAVKEKQFALHNEGEIYKTVEYSQITALLIESIKELKEQNNQLRADIEELKVNK